MTDNRTTELLREGLTERGIEWSSGLEGVTFVGDWCFVEYDNGKLAATCEPVLTPDQAIAATLGVGECAQCAKDMGAYADSLCDPLKERINKLLRCLENDWNISASWDGLRKFWCIELTEEGVKLRDATHGTLTAEQVHKAVKGHGNIMDNRLYEDWEAVADELNAKLGSEVANADDALSLLDEIREAGRISYDDYSQLFDAIAELGSGTCEPNWVLQGETQTQEFWRCECGNCGECFGVEIRESFPFKMTVGKVDVPNFCPNCGKAVKR